MPRDDFALLGDALWLDFVNSARGRTPAPPDLLPDSAAFVRWAGLHHLDAAHAVAMPRVIGFRARLTELAETMRDGRRPPGGAIAAINEQLTQSMGSRQLVRVGGEWQLRFAPSRSLGALEAVAGSAAATLADGGIVVRQCAGDGCSLLFTDSSHDQRRIWCDAERCGKDARVERRRGLRG